MENITNNSFLIIDGNSIMNRAFYAIKLLSTKDGTYTNACYGFLNIYYMMMEKLKPSYVAVSFDISKPTFRHKMYDEYKAGRKSMPDELRPQMLLIKDILKAMNIEILELEGYEADDILGSIAKNNSKNGIFTYILTGDRDSFQLISKNTSVIMPSTKMGKTEYTIYTPEKLKEVYNITPSQVIDLKALMGDKSDNIPGVPKVGEKTANSLLDLAGNIDNLYNNIDNIDIAETLKERLIEYKDIAYLSYKLATINTDVPLNINYDKLKLSEVNLPELTQIFNRLAFKKFLEKYNIDENNTETKESISFFKDLKNTKFSILNINEGLDTLLNKSEEIFFTYLDENFAYNKLKNCLIILANNEVFIIKINEFNRKNILKAFCEINTKKIGYNIKKLFKIYFDEGFNEISNFSDDIMIAYYLVNSTESNYSIDNIIYSLLKIPMPEFGNNKSKEQVQTSLFDIIDVNVSDNFKLDDIEKKYIYTYLLGIKKCNSILNDKINELNLTKLYYEIEMPLIETLANIESNADAFYLHYIRDKKQKRQKI